MARRFRLVRHFTIASFIAIGAAAVVLGLLYEKVAKNDVIDLAQMENVTRARTIVDRLWADIEPPIHALEGFEGEALRGHSAVAEITARMTDGLKKHFTILAVGAVKIKIFSPKGLTVFSTNADDIGKDGSRDAGVIAAVAGDVFSKLVHKHVFSSPKGVSEHVDMIESYIPIRHGGPETPIEAVFELYYDVTHIIRQVDRTRTLVIIGVALTLIAVYGILLLIIVRADRIIRSAEASVRESEERFRSVVDSTTDAVVAIDAHGNVLSWNKGASSAFGYDRAEMMGKSVALLIPERYGKAHDAALKRIRETGETRLIGKTVELAGRRKDGAEFPLELSIGMWKAGKEIYYSGIIRDTSERKKLERQFRQAQRMESLGSLAGGITHELNNLLLPILTLSKMALNNLPEDHSECEKLKIVVQAGERAKDLVAQVLAFSRREDAERKNIEISALVRQAMELVRATTPSTVSITENIDENGGVVSAAAGQIQTIIVNLVSNAVDAMGGRVGRMGVSLLRLYVDRTLAASIRGLEAGDYVKLSVSDTGCGMDAATMERIFDPFFTTKAVGKGTGLGLFEVYEVVTRHGGAVYVSSEVGKGTTFEVYLPSAEEKSGEGA